MFELIRNIRWFLYWRVTDLYDNAPQWLEQPLDWLRDVLRDDNDKRYWYD